MDILVSELKKLNGLGEIRDGLNSYKDVMNQARSFKIVDRLANFSYNLFLSVNKRCFNTGVWRGLSPLSRAKIKYG